MLLTVFLPSNSPVQAQSSSPDYGASVFLLGNPTTTARDLALVKKANLNWIKMAVPWRSIEPSCKNCIDWDDLDRVVLAASQAGLKIMARVDHTPDWARAVPAPNAQTDVVYNSADCVSEMARLYANGSPKGTIQAIQIWNEPNLSREGGGTGVEAIISPRSAVQDMSVLGQSYLLIKEKDPTKIVVSAGLSPTGTNDGTAVPDDVYLTWLYENDLKEYADAIGVHAPGYRSPPEAEINSDPSFPHPSFYFRRVEQMHDIMVQHGDARQ